MTARLLIGLACAGWLFGSALIEIRCQDLIIAEKILEEFWRRENDNAIDARVAFEGLAVPSNDARLAYAFQRMNHYRYREALPVARELVRLQPDHIEALAAVSWLETLLGSNNEALITMRGLRQAIDGLDPTDQAKRFYLQHLGRLIGFLEGPGNRQVNRQTFEQTVALIVNGLPQDNLAAFENSRQDVLNEFAQLKQDQELARNNFLNDAQQKAAAESANIQNANQTLAQQRNQIPTRTQSATDTINQRSTSIRNQINPLESQYRMLETQLFPLANQWQNLMIRMSFLDRRFSRPNDPPSQFDQFLLNQLAFEAAALDSQILFIRQQMRGLELQVASLNQDLYILNQQLQEQLQGLRIEDQQLARQMERNSARIQKLVAGPTRVTGDALSIAQRIDKLKTYDDFAIEHFRSELLKKIRAQKPN
ncbi:MAG: hypothetical protein KF851_17705 [Pirellulaceae bacterium]|nr:hypothetical protein [Pirellulaceae bacterium]